MEHLTTFQEISVENFQKQRNVWIGFSVFPVVFLFFKATLDTTLRFSRPSFGKSNWFVQMVNAIPGRDLIALNFAYHLPKPWTEWYVRVNDKQPKTRIILGEDKPGISLRFQVAGSECDK